MEVVFDQIMDYLNVNYNNYVFKIVKYNWTIFILYSHHVVDL